MKVQELPISPPADQPRTGLHLSSILKWLLKQQDAKRYAGVPTADDQLNWQLGLAWEDHALAQAFMRRVQGFSDFGMRLGEVEFQPERAKEGIICTADAVSRQAGIIFESKLTDMGDAPITDTKFKHWHWQGMGYCRVWGMRQVVYLVCHIRGDYKERRRVIHAWHCQYSRVEVSKNWRMLMNSKADMQEQAAGEQASA